eukprot:scaffold320_cov335-Pavlova_lutheri.AAC.11
MDRGVGCARWVGTPTPSRVWSISTSAFEWESEWEWDWEWEFEWDWEWDREWEFDWDWDSEWEFEWEFEWEWEWEWEWVRGNVDVGVWCFVEGDRWCETVVSPRPRDPVSPRGTQPRHNLGAANGGDGGCAAPGGGASPRAVRSPSGGGGGGKGCPRTTRCRSKDMDPKTRNG